MLNDEIKNYVKLIATKVRYNIAGVDKIVSVDSATLTGDNIEILFTIPELETGTVSKHELLKSDNTVLEIVPKNYTKESGTALVVGFNISFKKYVIGEVVTRG